MKVAGIRFVFLWALAFGAAATVLRLSIHAIWGVRFPEAGDVPGFLLGFAGQVAFGSILALAGLRGRMASWVALGMACAFAFFANVATFHYEAIFERLPGTRVLYYFQEVEHVQSSLQSHAPWLWVILETLVPTGILVWLAVRLRKVPSPAPARAILASSGLAAAWGLAIVTHALPSLLPQSVFWQSRIPLVYLAQSAILDAGDALGPAEVDAADLRLFLERLGRRIPPDATEPLYPLCESRAAVPRPGNGRSVVLLILESVGETEVYEDVAGRPVMPSLRRIATENLHFTDFYPAGDKSCQAMPAVFAGMPAQPAGNLLWRTPLNALECLPLALRERGYRTAYFHGSDLGFEQQRDFLRMAGFEELHELDVRDPTPVYGWGLSDRVTLGRLRTWLEQRRTEDPDEPFLAVWFSLSSHDPFLLPPDVDRVFSKAAPTFSGRDGWLDTRYADTPDSAFRDTLRFLDTELGAFYDWFESAERDRGTLLVLVGDHPPQHRLGGGEAIPAERFRVPLVLAGAPSSANRPSVSGRPGCQADLPSTLRGLLDLERGRCEAGRDLLEIEAEPADSRWILTVSGDQLETLTAWTPDGAARLNRLTRAITVDGTGRALDADSRERLKADAGRFFDAALHLSAFLIREDAFSPPPSTLLTAAQPVEPLPEPIRVSGGCSSEDDLERALRAGYRWIGVDVQITRDGRLVLIDAPGVASPGGTPKPIHERTFDDLLRDHDGAGILTLDTVLERYGDRASFVVRVAPQSIPSMNLALSREASRVLRGIGGRTGVVAVSPSSFLASALKLHCDCPVGLDVPEGIEVTDAWLRSVRLSRLDWLVVPAASVSPDLVTRAHRGGIRVLIDGANEGGAPAGSERPDGWMSRKTGPP